MKKTLVVAKGILFSGILLSADMSAVRTDTIHHSPAPFAAPVQPVNPSPSNTGGSPLVNTPLCATVSDPDGGNLTVTYYGRPKIAPVAGNQKFTVILLPDTQYYTAEPQGTNNGNNSMFKSQTSWIANNRVTRNIAFVGQLGDCTEHGDANEVEWKRVDTAIKTIEDPVLTGLPQGIPYGLSVGNHDQSPNGGGASASTNFFNQYFGFNRYTGRAYYGGHFGSNNDNHYELFTASGIDFLVISMEYDTNPSTAVLDWAAGLVQTYNNRKVIVMTHFGINETGSPQPSFGTQGLAIYNKLRSFPNFILFVCGHIHQSDGEARRSDAFNGNTVHTLLSDYQGRTNGGSGLLRIMEFDPATNKISVKTYSPVSNAFETDADSQFDITVNLAPTNNFTKLGQLTNVASGSRPCFNWNGLNSNTEYEWFMEISDGTTTTTGPVWNFSTTFGAALPVTLVNLKAAPDEQKVKIDWTTVYEKDNLLFEVERSLDGSHFTTIGNINGHGNSTDRQAYSFYDEKPLAGVSYYRVKQVDIDRKASRSGIVSVVFGLNSSKFIVYPNPARLNEFRIALVNQKNIKTEVDIYGTDGKLYYQKVYFADNIITINHNLGKGTYILKITNGEFSQNQKLVID
jgi:hypothetical protein